MELQIEIRVWLKYYGGGWGRVRTGYYYLFILKYVILFTRMSFRFVVWIHIWIEKVDKPNQKIFTSRDLILRILNKCLDLVRCHQVYYEFQLYLVLKLSYQAEMRKIMTRTSTLYTNHDKSSDFMNHLLKRAYFARRDSNMVDTDTMDITSYTNNVIRW